MKIFVIPATYNEAENIEALIKVFEDEVFPKIKNHDMHILVADDFSPDGTGEIVKKLMKKYNNLKLSQGERKGLGAAYVRAMSDAVEKSEADFVVSIDADFQFNPHDLPKYIRKIEEGYDMVIQTRYSNGGSIPPNWPIQRKLFSKTANLFVRFVFMRFYIHDWTGGFRAISKDVFLKVRPRMKGRDGYIFQIAFLHEAVKNGFKIGEVPLHFTDRKLGMSKIAPLNYIIDVLSFVITARIKELAHSPFLKYAITGFLGYLINAISLEIFAGVLLLAPFIAGLLSAELSIIWNFFVNNFWAFKSQRITDPKKLFLKFLQFNLVSAGSLVIIATAISLATNMFGNTTLVRQVTLLIVIPTLVIPYSYSMYNIFIWKRWHIASLTRLQKKLG